MCRYIEGTFVVPTDLPKEFFERLGYKKVDYPLYDGLIAPLTPLSQPSTLKFYLNWKHSTCKNQRGDHA